MPISYQAQSPVLGLVLPSNSPGVHTLWLPIIPMQIGLVLKPGPQEPWTPYRMAAAFFAGRHSARGDLDLSRAARRRRRRARQLRRAASIFGGTADRRSLPRQPARAGARPGLLEDPARRRSGRSLGAVSRHDGRERVRQQRPRAASTAPGIWASRHTREIADALAQRLAAIRPLPPEHPDAALAAFTVPGVAEAISQSIDADLKAPGVTDVTAQYRDGGASSRTGAPTICCRPSSTASSPDAAIAKKEYMFPFVTVVECPKAKMLDAIGPTLVCSAMTCNETFRRRLLDAVHIDRLNLGPVPTTQLNWLPAARGQHRRLPVPAAGVPVGASRELRQGPRAS